MSENVYFLNTASLPKVPEVWVCLCGCVTFRLYSDGSVQCAKCDEWAGEMTVRWSDPV